MGDEFLFFTDGPPSELKKKFMVKLLFDVNKKLCKKVTWKFQVGTILHDKGVVDSIGGMAKYLVRKHLMARRCTV